MAGGWGKALIGLGLVGDDDLIRGLARQYGIPGIQLSHFSVDPEIARLILVETATKYEVLPLSRLGSSLTLAMVDPTNVFAMDQIKFMTGQRGAGGGLGIGVDGCHRKAVREY